MPLVSVIVPIYNVEKYLEQCVNSLLTQSLKDIEILLFDDGSTDSSPQICDRYAELDSRVIVVHQKNQGVCKTRNDAIAYAHAPYINVR